MGASLGGDDGRIGLLIDTESNLAGLKAARTEQQGFTNDIRSGAAAASQSSEVVTITAAQQAAAWAQASGSVHDYNVIIAGMVADQRAAAKAAADAGTVIVESADAGAVAETNLASATGKAAEAQATSLAVMGNAASKAAAAQEFGSRAAVNAGRSYDAISPKARSAANSFAILSQVAVMGTGSMAGIANAAGLAGQSIAAMSESARIAALASGIGALITVAATVVGVLASMRSEAKATSEELEHVGNINIHGADATMEQARAARDAAAVARDKAMTGDIRDFLPWSDSGKAQKAWQQAQAYVDALTGKVVQLHVAEDQQAVSREISFTRSFQDQTAQLLMQERIATASNRGIADVDSTMRLKHDQMVEELAIQQRQTEQSYIQYDAMNRQIPIGADQIKQRDELLSLEQRIAQAQFDAYERQVATNKLEADNAAMTRIRLAESEQDPNNKEAAFGAALQQYQDQQDAAVRAGENETLAQQETNLKVRALRKATAHEAMANYAAITDAMLNSNNRAVKAVGQVADTIRRVMIGADGAHSAVLAIKEGAAAIGSAAAGNWGAAALHAESALAYGKAAALALTESLGSGGSGGGGGGGSGGGSNTTFEPSQREGAGNMVLVLNSVDPYSGAAINSVAYQLQRGQVLNKPIVIPPTTGLVPAAG